MEAIDFRHIELTDLNEEKFQIDISKQFGNYLYRSTGDLGMLDVAQEIYRTGELKEPSIDIKQSLLRLLHDPNCELIALLKKKLIETIAQGL